MKNKSKQFQTPHEAKATSKAAQPPKATKPAKPAKVRHGKLGSLLGHSIVSVVRAMGKHGWTFEDAQAALSKSGIDAAAHTVRVGLKRGRDGDGTRRIAPLSAKELDTLKAKKSAKGKTSA